MHTNKYDVVMFLETGAMAVSDIDLQIPDNGKIYAYAEKQNLMRKFEIGTWNSAVKITDSRFNQVVNKYIEWVKNEGQCDNRFQERIKIRAALIEQSRRAIVQRKREIKDSFSKYNISCLWHTTHKNNISSILKYGIMNHNDAHKLVCNLVDISDSRVQTYRKRIEPCYNRKIHYYAPLYINPLNPMLYVLKNRQDDLCLLEVSLSALNDNEFIISDGNAASRDTRFNMSINGFDTLSWDVLHAKHWSDLPDGKRKRCAEVLVYPKIQPEFVTKIHCYSNQTLNYLSNCGREVSLTKNLFF